MSTILIVDDSLTVRMDLAEALNDAGFHTVLCGTIADARVALRTQPIALAILDIQLPDGDGVDLLIQIRKDFTLGELPVLMLFLSWMMVSEVKYPTFKGLGLKAKSTFIKTLVSVLAIGSILILQEKIIIFVLPCFFTAYLLYGFIRPHISRKMREEIEDENEEEMDDSTTV